MLWEELIKFVIVSFLCLFVSQSFALEQQYFKAKKFKTPKREQSIIISKEGYYPQRIHIFAGEKVKFYVTSTTNEPSCLILPEKEIFVSVSKGKITEAEAVFEKPAVYKFYCPTGKINGRLVVKERESDRRERIKRKIASEKRVKIWRPKDLPNRHEGEIDYGE